MRSLAAAIAVIACTFAASPARAGRSPHAWLYGAEVLPERGVEIESWITEVNQRGDANIDDTTWLWAIAAGITDQLELSVPLEILWERSGDPMAMTRFTFGSYGAELRWRLVSGDPVDAPPFAPLIRVAAKRITGDRKAALLEADAVASYSIERVQILVDLGVAGVVHKGEDQYVLRPGGGVSVEVIDDLRIGAEAHAEIGLRGDTVDWVTAGPSLAWTHGRLWLTVVAGVGIYQIQSAPRLKVGVAF